MAIERGATAEVAPTPAPHGGSPARPSSPAGAGAAGSDEEAPPIGPLVRIITLNHGEHQDSTLYRFQKGTLVQFCPGPSLLGRKVFLYTNYVITDSQDEKAEVSEFVRNQYYLLEWRRVDEEGSEVAGDAGGAEPDCGALVTDTDLCCELRLTRAGAFHFYFVYDNAENPIGPQGSGWVHAAPALRVGPGGRDTLPVEAITCQTVLAKCLGPFSRWENTLRVSKESGFNMIHFTPIQELGASDSSYSLADQLKLNPRFGPDASFADVENLVSKMRSEWRVASICDVVLNHTANESPWLAEHPEATYNCANCPRLRPAALLDAALARVTRDAARGDLAARGIPARVHTHEHLEAVRHYLATAALPELRLHELFTCDVAELLQQFYCVARNKVPPVQAGGADGPPLALQQDPHYRRLRATVDMDRALQIYNVYRADCYDEESRLKKCCEELRCRLEALNAAARDALDEHLRQAVDNCVAGMRYFRLQSDGPKIEEVSAKNPLVPRYFTGAGDAASAAEAEAQVFGDAGRFVMAHNGWVMDADPLQDFAAEGNVYLRRELIAWGDSVKLRYGDKPEDSPWLWARMREYVELTAELFDGLRLDNCHSTPLHVAEWLVDAARNVRPDLFVAAELFTNSDHVDNIFVNRLGISALIREAQAAWDAREQGRLLHRFGGRCVGGCLAPRRARAAPGVAPALLLDLTHDNPSPLDKRSVHDALPTAALVAAACCATGSTRGLDELVPHHIHVVDETRLYPEWGEGSGRVGATCGLVAARRELNTLHAALAREGYDELYVDQMTDAVACVTRHSPRTRRSVLVVAHTAFAPPAGPVPLPPPLRFEGDLDEILFEMELEPRGAGSYERHEQFINGLPSWGASVRRRVPLGSSRLLAGARRDGAHSVLEWLALPPGAALALRVVPRPPHRAALARLHRLLAPSSSDGDALGLASVLGPLDLADFNALLYRCDAEERAANDAGVYDVPGHGPLVYAGLQGVMSLLDEIRANDDLGHALCDNLRAGDWLLEYTWRRLRSARLAAVGARFRELFAPLGELPRYLVPAYAEGLLRALHAARAAGRRGAGRGAAGRVARAAAAAPARRARLGDAVGGPAALRRGLHALLGPRHLHRAARLLPADGPGAGRARAHPRLRRVPAPRAHPEPAGRRPRGAVQLPRRRLVVALRDQAVRDRGSARRSDPERPRVETVPEGRQRARAARRRRPAALRRHAGGPRGALPGAGVPRTQRRAADRRAHDGQRVQRADRHRPRDGLPVRRQRGQLRDMDGQDGVLGGGGHARPARHAARRQRHRARRARVRHRGLAGRPAPRRPLPARRPGAAPCGRRAHLLELRAVGRAHPAQLRAVLLGARRAVRRRPAAGPRAPPRHLQGQPWRVPAVGRLSAAVQRRRRHGRRARPVRPQARVGRARHHRAPAARPARAQDARPGRLGVPPRVRQQQQQRRPERRARVQLPPGARVGVAARLLPARAARLRARRRALGAHARGRARRARRAARRTARVALARPARADRARRRAVPRLVPHAGMEQRRVARAAARAGGGPARAPAAARLTSPAPPAPCAARARAQRAALQRALRAAPQAAPAAGRAAPAAARAPAPAPAERRHHHLQPAGRARRARDRRLQRPLLPLRAAAARGRAGARRGPAPGALRPAGGPAPPPARRPAARRAGPRAAARRALRADASRAPRPAASVRGPGAPRRRRRVPAPRAAARLPAGAGRHRAGAGAAAGPGRRVGAAAPLAVRGLARQPAAGAAPAVRAAG